MHCWLAVAQDSPTPRLPLPQVAVWSSKLGDWPKAAVAQFNPADGRHLLRYLERAQGAVKHHEEWVVLGRTRFQWLAPQPPGAAPNPSHAAAPRGEDAVGAKVRVFWPGMCRWYTGKVRGGLWGERVGGSSVGCSAAAVAGWRLAWLLLCSSCGRLEAGLAAALHQLWQAGGWLGCCCTRACQPCQRCRLYNPSTLYLSGGHPPTRSNPAGHRL